MQLDTHTRKPLSVTFGAFALEQLQAPCLGRSRPYLVRGRSGALRALAFCRGLPERSLLFT